MKYITVKANVFKSRPRPAKGSLGLTTYGYFRHFPGVFYARFFRETGVKDMPRNVMSDGTIWAQSSLCRARPAIEVHKVSW